MELRRARLLILMMIILTILAQQSNSGEEESEKTAFLDVVISADRPITLENRHVTHAIAMLRHNYGCVISVERIEHTPEDRFQRDGHWLTRNRPLVNRSFSNLTARQSLDELVVLDPGYHWKVYDGKYVVFEPRTEKYGGKEKSILDTLISVSADNVSLLSLLSTYGHPFGRELFYEHGLGFSQVVIGRIPEFDKILISVHLENVTLRDAFNAIVTAAEEATGDRFRWFIKGGRHNGLDKYGKAVSVRHFTFHRLRQDRLDLITDRDS